MLLLAPLFFAGYYAIGGSVDPARAVSLRSSLDDAIPFVPEAIYVYVTVYTALLLPLFTVRCPRLFRRVVFAYAAAIGVALLCFAAFPVSSLSLRPDLEGVAGDRFALWGVELLYSLDPPANLFPSVHLAISALAALASWEARRIYGACALALTTLVGVSICLVKQHFAIDGVAGLALALVVWALLIRPGRASFVAQRAWGWRGPASYLGLTALCYGGAFWAYRSGLSP